MKIPAVLSSTREKDKWKIQLEACLFMQGKSNISYNYWKAGWYILIIGAVFNKKAQKKKN